MRETNQIVEVVKMEEVTQELVAVAKDIMFWSRNDEAQVVEVTTALFDAEGNEIKRYSQEIVGDYFDMLMSRAPIFDVGKEQGDFRKRDLWVVLEQLEINYR